MQKLQNLINECKDINFFTTESTFLEVSGFPHYENVCSNILAFFFDPEKEHNFKECLLVSLQEKSNISFSNVSVYREVTTRYNKRIDIVIESDNDVIAIENKIYHSINNPFDEYNEYLTEKYKDKKIHKHILGLNLADNLNIEGFSQIDYLSFIERVKKNIGHYIPYANQKYLTMLFDFITTIENLSKGTTMELEELDFINENKNEIQDLNKLLDRFKQDMRAKVKNLDDIFMLECEGSIIKKGLWREKNSLTDCFYCEISTDAEIIVIDTIVSPEGWKIEVFQRNPITFNNYRDTIYNTLKANNLIFKEKEERFEFEKAFSYKISIEEVYKEMEIIIKSILTIQP